MNVRSTFEHIKTFQSQCPPRFVDVLESRSGQQHEKGLRMAASTPALVKTCSRDKFTRLTTSPAATSQNLAVDSRREVEIGAGKAPKTRYIFGSE